MKRRRLLSAWAFMARSLSARVFALSSGEGYEGANTGTYPEYCSKMETFEERGIPALPLDFLQKEPTLQMVMAVFRHGARTPASGSGAGCWRGYDVEWNCNLTNVVRASISNSTALLLESGWGQRQVPAPGWTDWGRNGEGVVDTDMLFRKVYDGSSRNVLYGDCELGQLLEEGYWQARKVGEILYEGYIGGGIADGVEELWTGGGGGDVGEEAQRVKSQLQLFSSMAELVEAVTVRHEAGTSNSSGGGSGGGVAGGGSARSVEGTVRFRVDDEQRTRATGESVVLGLIGIAKEQELAAAVSDSAAGSDSAAASGGGGGVWDVDVEVLMNLHTGDYGVDWIRYNRGFCPNLPDLEKLVHVSEEWIAFNTSARVDALANALQEGGFRRDLGIHDCIMCAVCSEAKVPSSLTQNLTEELVWYTETADKITYTYNDSYAARVAMSGLSLDMGGYLRQVVSNSNHGGRLSDGDSDDTGTSDSGGDDVTGPDVVIYYPWDSAKSPRTEQATGSGSTVGDGLPNPNANTNTKTVLPKLVLYSGHDSTVAPLLAVLLKELWDGAWPTYAALLTIETYSVPNEEHVVRLVYNGRVLQPPGCPSDGLCPASVILSLLHDSSKLRSLCIQPGDNTHPGLSKSPAGGLPTSVPRASSTDGKGDGGDASHGRLSWVGATVIMVLAVFLGMATGFCCARAATRKITSKVASYEEVDRELQPAFANTGFTIRSSESDEGDDDDDVDESSPVNRPRSRIGSGTNNPYAYV